LPIQKELTPPSLRAVILSTAIDFAPIFLDGLGDWPGAQKMYADAVALAPDLPSAY
jgi:hypothetical protein